MVMNNARHVVVEWPDGSRDVWEDITVEYHVTGPGGAHAASPEAKSIKYHVAILPEGKLIDHTPAPEKAAD